MFLHNARFFLYLLEKFLCPSYTHTFCSFREPIFGILRLIFLFCSSAPRKFKKHSWNADTCFILFVVGNLMEILLYSTTTASIRVMYIRLLTCFHLLLTFSLFWPWNSSRLCLKIYSIDTNDWLFLQTAETTVIKNKNARTWKKIKIF